MKREEFQGMKLVDQVNYINENMAQEQSLSQVCNELGISKSISAKFLSHNYYLDKTSKQYILKQIEGQETLFNKPQEKEKAEIDTITLPKVIIEPQTSTITRTPTEESHIETYNFPLPTEVIKKTGRPQKYIKDAEGKNLEKKKLTLEIDNRTFKALQVKKALEGITLNAYVEELLSKYIDKKYFDMVDN